MRQGEKIDLLCKAPFQGGARVPLLYCRFEVPGENPLRVTPDLRVPDITWFGEPNGLDQGECGITIQRVLDKHNGPVRCSLGAKGSSDEYIGILDLTVGGKWQKS